MVLNQFAVKLLTLAQHGTKCETGANLLVKLNHVDSTL